MVAPDFRESRASTRARAPKLREEDHIIHVKIHTHTYYFSTFLYDAILFSLTTHFLYLYKGFFCRKTIKKKKRRHRWKKNQTAYSSCYFLSSPHCLRRCYIPRLYPRVLERRASYNSETESERNKWCISTREEREKKRTTRSSSSWLYGYTSAGDFTLPWESASCIYATFPYSSPRAFSIIELSSLYNVSACKRASHAFFSASPIITQQPPLYTRLFLSLSDRLSAESYTADPALIFQPVNLFLPPSLSLSL